MTTRDTIWSRRRFVQVAALTPIAFVSGPRTIGAASDQDIAGDSQLTSVDQAVRFDGSIWVIGGSPGATGLFTFRTEEVGAIAPENLAGLDLPASFVPVCLSVSGTSLFIGGYRPLGLGETVALTREPARGAAVNELEEIPMEVVPYNGLQAVVLAYSPERGTSEVRFDTNGLPGSGVFSTVLDMSAGDQLRNVAMLVPYSAGVSEDIIPTALAVASASPERVTLDAARVAKVEHHTAYFLTRIRGGEGWSPTLVSQDNGDDSVTFRSKVEGWRELTVDIPQGSRLAGVTERAPEAATELLLESRTEGTFLLRTTLSRVVSWRALSSVQPCP